MGAMFLSFVVTWAVICCSFSHGPTEAPQRARDGPNKACPKVDENTRIFESTLNDTLAEFVKDIDQKILLFMRSFEQRGLKEVCKGQEAPQDLHNLALKKTTFATSVYYGENIYHTNAVDGKYDTSANSAGSDVSPWLGVDLGKRHKIYFIDIYVNTGHFAYFVNIEIFVSDTRKEISNRSFTGDVLFASFKGPPKQNENIFRLRNKAYIEGRYVYVKKHANIDYLSFSEVEVFGI